MNKKITYTHRHLARVLIEAATPLVVGFGDKDILTDAVVATDVNGLPYIPGTALAGVFRHILGEHVAKAFFGFQGKDKHEGKGSEIVFTEAKMVGFEGKPIDGLQKQTKLFASTDERKKAFYHPFVNLPIRQHVRINAKGTNEDAGKFDEQVVYKGARFCFEIEMVSGGSEEDKACFHAVLNALANRTFRIGGGSRKGFGEIKVVSIQEALLDLQAPDDLRAYLKKSSSLAENWGKELKAKEYTGTSPEADEWSEYMLTLQPEDFYLFSSGFGNDQADITPVSEAIIEWSGSLPALPFWQTQTALIPASSVKGALSHRVAYHYNLLNQHFAGEGEATVGNENPAVQALFGYENSKWKEPQKRGNILLSDIIEAKNVRKKVLNHVAIDRFTGGAIHGALFDEETIYGKGERFTFKLLVNQAALKKEEDNKNIQQALENALQDICTGLLPLGGGVNRGNGVFNGTITKDGKELHNE